MAETRRRRLAALEQYLSSLAADNAAWRHKAAQRQDTFSGRLQREDGSGKGEGVPRRAAPVTCTPPVHIRWSPEEGRHLVAARDIAAGEEVFREAPMVVTPQPDAAPVCLACLTPLKEQWPACGGCGAPLCTPPCDGEMHGAAECRLLAGLGLQQDRGHLLLMNQVLTPLRTLLVLQAAPETGCVVEAMQSNAEKRRRAGVGQGVEGRVVAAMRRLGVAEDEGVVRHICGVFDTNAFMMGGGRALLPLAALMNHDCSANTQHWFCRGALVVRAARAIPGGAALTNTYTPLLWGTRARAALLASKLFRCGCARCRDPCELGTHLSSVRCRQCPEGLMPPPAPPEAAWRCGGCGASVAGAAVEAMVRAGATAGRGAVGDAAALRGVARQLCRLLGEAHYVTVAANHALLEATMARPTQDLPTSDLRNVVDLCDDLLRLADLLDPGLSRFRGVLLLERVRASAELLTRQIADSSDACFMTLTEEPVSAHFTTTTTAAATITATTATTTTAAAAAAAAAATTTSATSTTCDTNDNDKRISSPPNFSPSLQCLTEAAKESENILQFDALLPRVQEVLRLLQDLQSRQEERKKEEEEEERKRNGKEEE